CVCVCNCVGVCVFNCVYVCNCVCVIVCVCNYTPSPCRLAVPGCAAFVPGLARLRAAASAVERAEREGAGELPVSGETPQGGEGAKEDGDVPAESRPQEEGERGEKKGRRQTDESGRILSCDTEKTVCRSRRIHRQKATED
ncbi:hypothetical protein PHYPO_G00248880, partial [Pangasianodon hypophthalmus]